MREINIARFENSVVIHFDTENKQINAYTLASTLVALADAAKAANTTLNAGCEIEIVVEAFGAGSFRARISALYSKTNNLFSKDIIVINIIVSLLASYIYERTLSIDNQVKIEIKTEEVIIQNGNDRILIPRNVYDATRRVEKNSKFTKAMNQTFEAVSNDTKVKSFGIVEKMDSPPPVILIPRSTLLSLIEPIPDDQTNRTISEQADLQIVKAILDNSNRKWEFVWRGVTISAPVTDTRFYKKFFSHEITIAPGDVLTVTLSIKQVKDSEIGIYKNTGYEVIEVHHHVPRIKQTSFAEVNNKKKSNKKLKT